MIKEGDELCVGEMTEEGEIMCTVYVITTLGSPMFMLVIYLWGSPAGSRTLMNI